METYFPGKTLIENHKDPLTHTYRQKTRLAEIREYMNLHFKIKPLDGVGSLYLPENAKNKS